MHRHLGLVLDFESARETRGHAKGYEGRMASEEGEQLRAHGELHSQLGQLRERAPAEYVHILWVSGVDKKTGEIAEL
jgi:hypothetical protein